MSNTVAVLNIMLAAMELINTGNRIVERLKALAEKGEITPEDLAAMSNDTNTALEMYKDKVGVA